MNRSGLLALARAVKAYFDDNDVQAEVLVGLKERAKWASPRVVVIPGFFDGKAEPSVMKGGPIGAPLQKSSANPRELGTWARALTLSIYARNVTQTQDVRAQLAAVEDLLESAMQALWCGVDPDSGLCPGAAGIEWGETFYVFPPVQGAAGLEILLQYTFKQPMYDLATTRISPPLALGRQLAGGPRQGAKASVISVSGQNATIGGLAFADASWLMGTLTLSEAASPSNNGTFPVVQVVGPTSVVATNAAAVAGDAANGSIVWSALPPLGG